MNDNTKDFFDYIYLIIVGIIICAYLNFIF